MQSQPAPTTSRKSLPSIIFGLLGILYFIALGCVIAYIWVLTQDRFVSTASFKISRQNPSSGELGFATLALPGLSDTGSVDSQIAIGFVNSTDLLFDLEREFDLRDHYASPIKDFVFRLDPDALLEERLEYYRGRIFAHFDKETGLTVLSVDTFEPALSKKLAETILQRTEVFINTLNQTVADQQLAFIRSEVERAEKQVSDVTMELLTLQNTHNLVSPDEVITANLKAVQELRMERLKTETSLASIERDSPDSPRITTLRSQLRSLDEQIAVESTKISGPEKDRLNQILSRYKELQLKLEFAVNMRTSAETLLEKHRMDAAARSRFLSTIQHPYLPEDETYPRRPYATATIIGLGILLFLMLRVLVHSVYERVN
jgi:capsular polysaccharide transport system permease protein